jgi:hypothetical protein
MWKKELSAEEAAQIIARFLNDTYSHYPGEWSDFVESKQRDPLVERYRKRCDELDPLVNRPGEMDAAAVAELRSIMAELRTTSL